MKFTTSAYLPDGREVRTVILHRSPERPSFYRKDGPPFCLVGVPMDSELNLSPEYRGVELFLSEVGRVGAEALYSFAVDEDDPGFHVVREVVR